MTTATSEPAPVQEVSAFEKRVGHPPGLFVLFFAEMWERFSYYGMRALLVFYMIKGFLGYDDNRAYAVYGAYTSLVYMTPFIGGMIADHVLGPRRAVVIGGALMAAGHLLMTIEHSLAFFAALALLICGNGFFKPNISTMVGSLYGADATARRDGGFTLFYMGINLGAALAPLLCGYVGETFGWHYGFGLATIGMLTGLAIFVAPTRATQVLIGAGALATAAGLVLKTVGRDSLVAVVNLPIALALVVAAGFALVALGHGAIAAELGAPPKREGVGRKQNIVLVSTMLFVPVAGLLVHFHRIGGGLLGVFGIAAVAYVVVEALRSPKVDRDRLFVLLVMYFFSVLFWAFFEQAGSSMNNFADRNVDRVVEQRRIGSADVGKTLEIRVNQEQLGYPRGGKPFTLDQLDALRDAERKSDGKHEATRVAWPVTQRHVGMGVGGTEVPASEFQAANPLFILVFGLVFTALWGFLGKRRLEPSTPVKFALGLLQVGLGFGALWWGAREADARGMVAASWLILAYLLHTTGELCLSPVGLSMVTKLSPARMVSTMMGGWFLATAFSEYLAGLIATLTGVSHGGEQQKTIPVPLDTVNVYGDVFGRLAIAGCAAALLLFLLAPLLSRGMHPEAPFTGEGKR
jgi:POT family proton-dependent oligopeptide transporter